MHDPVDRLHPGRLRREARGGQQADRQVGAGPFEAQRVEAIRVDPLARPRGAARAGPATPPPGRARPGAARRSAAPRACASAVSSSTPGWTSRAHSGDGHGTTVQFVVLALITSKFSASAGSASRPARRRVDAGEQPGRHLRGDRDANAVAVAEIEEPPAVPRRHEVERVLGGPLEPDPLHVRVEVPRVDEARAALVGRGGDQPRERRRARLGDDPDGLAGLHVGPDLDDQVGVAAEERVVHGCAEPIRPARSSTVRPAPPL